MSQTFHGFEASLFHPGYGDEPVAGRIFVSGRVLKFQSEAVTLDIHIDSLDVEFQQNGPGLFFSDAAVPEVRIYTPSQAILKNPAIKTLPQVVDTLGRKEASRALKLTGYFLAGCIIVTWMASLAISGMVRVIVSRVPASWEEKLGQEEMVSLQSSGTVLNDTNNVDKLAALAKPLIKALPPGHQEQKFYILNDPEPNACAVPGGHVVVNTGLLQLLDKPEEVLGVLAHELAHQTQRHAIRKVVSAAGPLVICGVFMRSGNSVGNAVAMGSGMMVFQGFSQEYEMEADSVGWDYLVKANIDPRGMISALKKLEVAEWNNGLQEKGTHAFSSHPATEKRIARLEKKWSHLDRQSGFITLTPLTFTNLAVNQ